MKLLKIPHVEITKCNSWEQDYSYGLDIICLVWAASFVYYDREFHPTIWSVFFGLMLMFNLNQPEL